MALKVTTEFSLEMRTTTVCTVKFVFLCKITVCGHSGLAFYLFNPFGYLIRRGQWGVCDPLAQARPQSIVGDPVGGLRCNNTHLIDVTMGCMGVGLDKRDS